MKRPIRLAESLWLQSSAFYWVVLVRLGLRWKSYDWLRDRYLPPTKQSLELRPGIARVARAVSRAARFVPKASCLTQALSAQIMLTRRQIPSTLHIGVRRSETGGFEAHAWLEVAGTILLGGTQESVSTYRSLTTYSPLVP